MFGRLTVVCAALLTASSVAVAGPYAPAAGQPGSTAVANTDPSIAAWATGYTNYVIGADVDAQWQTPNNALGFAQGIVSGNHDVVVLGNGGQITLTFDVAIANGPGFDFAVFENALNDTFLELGYVEASVDGTNFSRFPNDSLTAAPVPAFAGIDPTNVTGLAGKYRHSFGTPFDLSDIGLASASHIRIVDIVGDGTYLDTSGDVIYDPYLTTGSGGFDLDGVAAINLVPEPGTAMLLLAAGGLLLTSRRRPAARL